jgi:hypothetical protein
MSSGLQQVNRSDRQRLTCLAVAAADVDASTLGRLCPVRMLL